MKTIISIIIPIYNVEPYIEECLLSVANQTMTDGVECILVDDCGSDNSIAIAESFIKSYDGNIKFIIIHHEKNFGLSAARNTGIKVAKGEYLYFLDSDDTIVPNCLEKLISLAKRYDKPDLIPALYICSFMEQFGKHSFPEYSDDSILIKRALLNYDTIPVTAANRLIKRSLIINNNLWFKEGIIHEDNHWIFFLAKHVKTMAFTHEKLYFYRETPGSITNKKNIQKESHAFNTMIRDFCNNIDDLEIGAQKRWIFLHLLMLKKNKYYNSKQELEFLINYFANKNTLIEKTILLLCMYYNWGDKINSRLINLLQKIYLRN